LLCGLFRSRENIATDCGWVVLQRAFTPLLRGRVVRCIGKSNGVTPRIIPAPGDSLISSEFLKRYAPLASVSCGLAAGPIGLTAHRELALD
jgi:hypothetical protein